MTTTLLAGLSRFEFKSLVADVPPVVIVAKSKKQAWAKFVAQRFGALKPARSDWKITK